MFQNTKHFKIQWLDKDEKTNVYKFDFLDHTEIECVLTNDAFGLLERWCKAGGVGPIIACLEGGFG